MYNYTYNADGIRTRKTVYDANGDYVGTTEYIYDGTKLIAEKRGNTWLYYFYDANGAVTGMSYNGTLYYFRKNLQGDVTGIYNATGTLVVEYEYTPYGAILSTTGSMATTIGAINPFRYRGYYYDTETELYYLITRYYDPEVGRFLNADAIVGANCSFVGYNSFAYCDNNPIMRIDRIGLSDAAVLGGYIVLGGTFAGMDGLFPFGDIIGGIVILVYAITTADAYDSSVDDGDIVSGECRGVFQDYPDYYQDDYEYYTDVLTLPTTSSVVAEREASKAVAKEEEKDIVETMPIVSQVYYGIDARNHSWNIVTPPMNFLDAYMWVIMSAFTHSFGKSASWGLYTHNEASAVEMATLLGLGLPPKPHPAEEGGYYAHYHVFGYDLFSIYKHFHVWYGEQRAY